MKKYLFLTLALFAGCEEDLEAPKRVGKTILCYSGEQVVVNLDAAGTVITGSTYVEFTDKDSGRRIHVNNAACIVADVEE